MTFKKGKWYKKTRKYKASTMVTYLHLSEDVEEGDTTYADMFDFEMVDHDGRTAFSYLYSPRGPEMMVEDYVEANEQDFMTIIRVIFMSERGQIR